MASATPAVAFLSDYGLGDEFVGVCKGVIAAFAPDARVIDLTHEIPPHDIASGALALARSIRYLPEGVLVLAVVDPGVGTDRRLIAVRCEQATFFGPDNGLLAPAVTVLDSSVEVVELSETAYHLTSGGATFAGRDVLAPALAHHAAGVPLADLGRPVDPASLVPGILPEPLAHDDGTIDVSVWWIDRFGNAQLNLGPDDLRALGGVPGGRIEVRLGDDVRVARWVRTYADAKPSELVLVVDGSGLCSLALDRRSAAAELGLRMGGAVTLAPPPPA